MNVKEKLGIRIRGLREQNAMTQKDLSFEADLDRSYIADIERGERNVSIENIEKIAHALGVSLTELFNHSSFSEKGATNKM